MLFKKELAELRTQREMLVARSDVQRSVLELEVLDLRSKWTLFQPGARWLKRAQKAVPLAAPLAGFVLARHWRRIFRWGGRYFLYKVLRSILR